MIPGRDAQNCIALAPRRPCVGVCELDQVGCRALILRHPKSDISDAATRQVWKFFKLQIFLILLWVVIYEKAFEAIYKQAA